MFGALPRLLILSCVSLAALSGQAAAQSAPITYAGSDGPHTSVNEPLALAGGGERSYGYGSAGRRRGAVIDIRRNSGARVTPVANFTPVAFQEDDDEQAPATPAPSTSAPQNEQGA